jgi:hypothetical protein
VHNPLSSKDILKHSNIYDAEPIPNHQSGTDYQNTIGLPTISQVPTLATQQWTTSSVVTFTNNRYITYIYNATGVKLKKVITQVARICDACDFNRRL